MKKIITLLLFATAMFCFNSCANQAENDYKYIKSKGTMKIGITIFAPNNYLDENGNMTGFDTEFANIVCKKLGLIPEFVEINWDLKETELMSKNIDCVWNGMTITEEIEKNLSVTIPYLNSKSILVTKNEHAESLFNNIEGTTIAVEQGSSGEQVTLFIQENVKCLPVESQIKSLECVRNDIADAAVVDNLMTFGSIGEGTDYPDFTIIDRVLGDPELIGIAFRKGSNMPAKVNKIIMQMTKDGSLRKLAEKYKMEILLTE